MNVAVGLNSGDVAEIVKKTEKKNIELEAELSRLEAKMFELRELDRKMTQLEVLMDTSAPNSEKMEKTDTRDECTTINKK